MFAEDEARVLASAARSTEELDSFVTRRCGGEPLEHVVGSAVFAGRRIRVAPGVFVPRRRTEHLARLAAERAATRAAPVVVDLCCGSGAIAVAVAASVPGVQVHAADVDPVAVRCARENLGRVADVAAEVHVHTGDLFDALPAQLAGRVDVLVANAPYVATSELRLLPREAREHEPRIALDGGGDGLDVVRRVAAGADRWLAPAGSLLVEVAEHQVAAAVRALATAGVAAEVVRDDDLGAVALVSVRGDVSR